MKNLPKIARVKAGDVISLQSKWGCRVFVGKSTVDHLKRLDSHGRRLCSIIKELACAACREMFGLDLEYLHE